MRFLKDKTKNEVMAYITTMLQVTVYMCFCCAGTKGENYARYLIQQSELTHPSDHQNHIIMRVEQFS